jgi:hypothetical protein
MNSILLFICVIFVNSIPKTQSEWQLVFRDEFNETALNERYWESKKLLGKNKKTVFSKYKSFQLIHQKKPSRQLK